MFLNTLTPPFGSFLVDEFVFVRGIEDKVFLFKISCGSDAIYRRDVEGKWVKNSSFFFG
jgi:hypothetical protein